MEQKKAGNAPMARRALGVAAAAALAMAAAFALGFAAADGSRARDGLAPAARAWIEERGALRVLAEDGYDGAATELARWMAAELGFRLEIRRASAEEAARELASGRADALVGPIPIGEDSLEGLAAPALETAIDRLAYPVGEAMPRSLLASGVERARRSGALGAIYAKWGDPAPAPSERYGAGRDERLLALGSTALGLVALGLGLGLALRLKAGRRPPRSLESSQGFAPAHGAEPSSSLAGALEALASDNARLGAENARLRLELEERSRLEEAKRRIDAATAARRVEELTRCVIAKALDETTEARRGGEPG